MWERILLLLDGSERAETALDYIRNLAGPLRAEVYLLQVGLPGNQSDHHARQIYLNNLADVLRKEIRETWQSSQGPLVHSDIIIGEPTKIILNYSLEKDIKLIVLTTPTTTGGPSRTLGRVEDRVFQEVAIPFFIIPVKDVPWNPAKGARIRRILLPLGRKPGASQIAIPYALRLAKKLDAGITLFAMAQTIFSCNLDTTGTWNGQGLDLEAIDNNTQKYAAMYLQEVEDEMRNNGLIDVNYVSSVGMDAAGEILLLEKKIPSDLVVLVSRGRAPLIRWFLGSITNRVLKGTDCPILLLKSR